MINKIFRAIGITICLCLFYYVSSTPVVEVRAATTLVAAYNFNEGTGAALNDLSGTGNNGTLTNGPVWTTAGKYGGALTFDGANDMVTVNDSNSLDLTNNMTLEAWVRPTSTSGWRTVLLKEIPTHLSYALYGNTGTNLPGVEIYTGTSFDTRNTVQLAVNTWTHMAATYDGAILRFYINGTQVSTKAASGNLTASANPLRIGGNTIWGEYFLGQIDDIRIYNGALTQAQIQSDMNTPVAALTPDTTAPTVSLTAPGSGSTVSGVSVPVSATAADNVGVIGVQFKLDGANLNAEDTLSPYSLNWDSTATANGPHTLTAVARDAAGNSTVSAPVSITVNNVPDTTPPTVSITAPAPSTTVNGAALTVSANAADNVGVAGVQFLLDGSNLNAEDTTTPYSTIWNTTTASNGPHIISARARDAAGNSTLASNVNITVDNQAPTGSVVINNGAAATNSTASTLTLSATDNSGTVSQMRFSNTGSSFSTAEAYATTKAWTLTTGAGVKTVYVQFKDPIGNWSASFTDTITLDTTAPTISAVSATNVTNNSATINWTTNEPATSQVEYGPTTAYGTLTTIDNTLVTTHVVTLSGLASSATYNYRARSKDAAGNEKLGTNNTFTTLVGPDTTPPTIPTNLSATPISSTQINLAWTASTDNIGVARYLIFRDTVQIATSTTTNFSNTGLQPSTSYSYTVAAQDASLNTSAQSAATIGTTPAPPDTIPPVVSITFPLNNAQVADIITITADADDNVAVAGVKFFADGVLIGSEDTTSPYGANWDTRAIANGAHTLTAIARDAAGNTTTSASVMVNVANSNFFQNEILATGFNLPTTVKFLPDGRMLITELPGTIKVVPPPYTTPDPTPFLQLNLNIPGYAGLQQGIFDLVFDPNFATNRYYYIFYTKDVPNVDRVSRFTANAAINGTVPGSELILYQDPQTANTEHHGGSINFGNDGKLYFTTGEHFDPTVSPLLTSPRGKIHRINADGTIPTDNPFYDGAGPNVDSIWARGLRNPFRAYYDVPTGRLIIGDVGGNDFSTAKEEVNVGVAGASYGWPSSEGNCSSPCTSPLYFYPHNGRDASITGGFVYHGTQFPSGYQGNYFFADYAQNWIRRLTFDANGVVNGVFNFEPADGSLDGPYGDIVYLTEGPDGALYYVDLGYSDVSGTFGISKIRRIRYIQSNQAPVAVAAANPTEGPQPLTVTFSSTGSSDPEGHPLSYSWTFGDTTTSTLANPTHVYTVNGRYTVRLSVSDGVNTTFAPPLFINVGNKPVPAILTPSDGMLFRAGDIISFSGDATDTEDGTLPASAYSWSIDFLHEGHVHPGSVTTGVKSGTFAIPTSGHDFSGQTRYRIILTVTDSDGLQNSATVIVWPDKVNLSFDSVPIGLTLTLDGIPHTTPFVYDTLIGFNHTIYAANQSSGPNIYTFASWSDAGAQQHTLVVPSSAQTYTATYTVTQNQLPFGLVAGYRLNEGSGTTTADLSGNNITGTLVNNPAWITGGKYGGAINFNGTSYVNLGNPAALQLTGSMTLSAWINISSNPFDDGAIIAKLGPVGWQLKTSPDTGVRTAAIQIASSSGVEVQRYSQTVLATNTWYHIAGVYDAAAVRLDIYVNGVLNNGVLTGTIPTSQMNANFNVNIAQRTGMPGGFNFIGPIDEVHVFNRALTATEIQNDMNIPR